MYMYMCTCTLSLFLFFLSLFPPSLLPSSPSPPYFNSPPPLPHLYRPVIGPSGEPVVAGIYGDAAHPAKMAADHPHQLPRRVPGGPHRLHGPPRHQLLGPSTQHQGLEGHTITHHTITHHSSLITLIIASPLHYLSLPPPYQLPCHTVTPSHCHTLTSSHRHTITDAQH